MNTQNYSQTSPNNWAARESGLGAFYWRVVLRPYFWDSLAVLFLMSGNALLDTLTIGFTVPLLDAVTRPREAMESKAVLWFREKLGWSYLSDPGHVIFVFLVIVTVFFILRGAFNLFNQICISGIAHKLRRSIKIMLLDHFLQARYTSLTSRGRGAILRDLVAPADSLYINISNLGFLLTSSLNVCLLIGMLMYLSWWMTVLTAAVALSMIYLWRRLADEKARHYGGVVYENDRSMSKLEVDSIDGIKVVKAHLLQANILKRYKEILLADFMPQMRLVFLRSAPSFINETVGGVAVLSLGALVFLAPSLGLSFSIFGAFLLALRRISPSVAAINASFVEFRRSQRGLEVIDEVLHAMPMEPSGNRALPDVERIEFDGLNFSYPTVHEIPTLTNINFDMQRGTITALVGPTGSGKSTLANLLLRFYEPTQGAIKLNGHDLKEYRLFEWRRKIGYVSQDVFLFNASIGDNIALWQDGVTQEQVEEACRLAQLHDFIVTLPEGYDTVAGDRGLRLSGGQCQRVAIARAILQKPQVLILDEATSALDNLTEKAIYEAIGRLRSQSVVIVIAHRLSTIGHADQVIVLENGRILESGSPPGLMEARGLFWRLCQAEALAAL
ncbi:MAG: ABC transporter ATP-binding protein [Elusimicrobia bacterium]|nr:ABC transporter ATP-binding protein [Elusimicrobiota bacterium]